MPLLDYLYNAFADQPLQRGDDGQITTPGFVPGLLNGMGNNSNALMQVGLGLMSGRNNSEAFANAAQGLQTGGVMDQREMLLNRQQAKEKRSQDAIAAYLKANPGMAKYVADPTNSEAVQGLANKQMEIDTRPKQFSFHVGGDGSLYAIDPSNPANVQKLGVPANMSELDRMLQEAGASKEERQQVYRSKTGLAGAKPELVEIEDPGSASGKRSVLQTMPTKDNPTGLWELDGKTPAQGVSQPANPYALQGKSSEDERKSAGFANRMAQSHELITNNEGINQGSGWFGGRAAETGLLPNEFKSVDRQKVEQAQRDFINALLRRESGATIQDPEFENARKQYFPQPGDSPEVIRQKRQNRETAIQGVMGGAGPGYRPPGEWASGKAPKYGTAGRTSSGLEWKVTP